MSATEVPTSIPGAPDRTTGLFVRQSSGLVREVGVRDSLGIGLGVLLLVAVYSVTAIFLDAFPNGDFYLPIIVGAAISALLAFGYAQLVSTFPRAGGEYVYASRVFAPIVGALVGGALLVTLIVSGSTNIVEMCQVYAPFMFTSLGHALHWPALVTFGSSTLSHKGAWMLIGLAIIAICTLVCLRPIQATAKWVFWAFAVGLITTLVVALILLFETRAGFVRAFNSASGPGAYQAILMKARAAGFHSGVQMSDVIALLPVGALLFLGFTFGNYAAGEIKRPSRTYKIAVFGALGVGFVGLTLGWMGMRHAAGLDFLQSSAYLATNDPTAYAHLTSVAQNQGGLAYATLAAGDPVTDIIIGVGAFIGWMSMAIAFFLVCTRVLFALSFDRLLPTKLAEVRPRTHAPAYALAVVTVAVGLVTELGNLTTLLTLFRNFLLLTNAILVIGSICAAALPYRRPDLFAASPQILRGRVMGVPVVSILAGLAAVAFLALDVDVGSRTAYSGGYSAGSIAVLAAFGLIGLLVYAVARGNLNRRGIDIRLAMRELPPE